MCTWGNKQEKIILQSGQRKVTGNIVYIYTERPFYMGRIYLRIRCCGTPRAAKRPIFVAAAIALFCRTDVAAADNSQVNSHYVEGGPRIPTMRQS